MSITREELNNTLNRSYYLSNYKDMTDIVFSLKRGVSRNNDKHYICIKGKGQLYGSVSSFEYTLSQLGFENQSITTERHVIYHKSKLDLYLEIITNLNQFYRKLPNIEGLYFDFDIEWGDCETPDLIIKKSDNLSTNSCIQRSIDDIIYKLTDKCSEMYECAKSSASRERSELMSECSRRKGLVYFKYRNKRKYTGGVSDIVGIKRNRTAVFDNENEAFKQTRFLYLMKDESDSGTYKIGISNNPKFRESTLQREKPSIKLVGKWAELSGFEKMWHSHFSENRIRGEWFKLSKYQVELFCSMCSKPLNELQKFFGLC